MKKSLFVRMVGLSLLFGGFGVHAQGVVVDRYPVIPYPTSLTPAKGEFVITPSTGLVVPVFFEKEGAMLNELFKNGLGVSLGAGSTAAVIELRRDEGITAEEGYGLTISPSRVVLAARTRAGMFMALQTVRQLLPPVVEGGASGVGRLVLPAVAIQDAPAYGWRGMHLDVSRHFFSIAYLRKFIDVMALYKMNRFHLHLTDDQGWRVEIKKYPLLTANGAWRTFNNQDSACMKRAVDDPDMAIDASHIIQRDGKTLYGGFYTQAELRDLVAYAADRHIEIIPEIDMPGHMMAAINQYNYLSCDGTSVFGALFSTPICPCLPTTFQFAQDVYSEIMDIFPSTYLHIGGDEVDRSGWAKSSACKELMAKEGLKDDAELQSYFIRKMEEFFNSKGRKLIGWDEILEGGVTKTAMIMYWRTWKPKAPVEAAKHGNAVIMTPGNPLYFDNAQDRNSLPNVYQFNPVPAGLTDAEAKNIIGAQANIWTEQIPTENRADLMYMPRMTALAEVLWTGPAGRSDVVLAGRSDAGKADAAAKKNYDSFLARLKVGFQRLDRLKVRYRLPDLSGFLQLNVFTNTDTLRIRKPLDNMTIRYTTDGSAPGAESAVLSGPLVIRESKLVRVGSFRADGSRGEIYDLKYEKQAPAEPSRVAGVLPGLVCSQYKGSFKMTGLMPSGAPDMEKVIASVNVPKEMEAPAFGLKFRGYLDIPQDGVYSFYLTCDDGGVLNIAGREVVNNDGNHAPVEKNGQVALKKGLQKLVLDFIEGGGGYTFKLKYSFNGSELREVPASWLKHASVAPGKAAVTPPKPYGVLPSKRQLAWHEMEMYCLIHFGVDTYTDKEWGYGDEDPAILNPVNFDARQIVAAAKAGGFKGVVIVAKHHDGLCLWPTKTTEHNITKSPFRGGKGDMIREYRQACDALGMKMGIYCSPWDRNNAAYGSYDYVKTYRAQIKELYTGYGPLFMSWHDGANGGDGYYGGTREMRKIDRTTYYGWDTTWAMVRQLQPGANIFGDIGPDVRWVGNEDGHAGLTCWATYTPHAPEEGKKPANGYNKYWEATEGTRDGEFWMPAECDVPLRPGWFYHATQDEQVKSPYQLLDLYYQSVGRGQDLDVGIAPNRQGLLDKHDVDALKGFGELLRSIFSKNLAAGATFTASNIRGGNASLYGPAKLTDNDRYSYWATDDAVKEPSLVINMGKPTVFNVIRLRENIKLGQRISAFEIDALENEQWVKIGEGTSIGACRLIRLQQNVVASKVRLRITGGAACVALSDFGLFREPAHLVAPSVARNRAGMVAISTESPVGSIHYTLDGSEPDLGSPVYSAPFELVTGGMVKARSFEEDKSSSELTTKEFGVAKRGWRIVADSKGNAPGAGVERAIDEDEHTVWSTLKRDSSSVAGLPQDMVVDMGKEENVQAFTYLPRQDKKTDGTADRYVFYTGSDGENWTKVAEGEFSNIRSNPLEQVVPLEHPVTARYFRFSILHVVGGNGVVVAEVGIR